MQNEFLRFFQHNHGKLNHFSRYLDSLDHEVRIAWYPSAGMDFRALFFLDDAFAIAHPTSTGKDVRKPDIFFMSDWCPGFVGERFTSALLNEKDTIIHDDGRTRVTVFNIEKLGRIDFSPYPSFRLHKENSDFFNNVYFFHAKIESNEFGEIIKPVLYAFSCNEQLCAELLLPKSAHVSHIIHVRYGFGFGGANSSGYWLHYAMHLLGTEMYINDCTSSLSNNDQEIVDYYKHLIPNRIQVAFETIREIDGKSWSDVHKVIWQRVRNRSLRKNIQKYYEHVKTSFIPHI